MIKAARTGAASSAQIVIRGAGTRPFDLVTSRLTGMRGCRARCPAHASSSLTLVVREMAGGVVVIKCHAGCSVAAVLAEIGLELRDLFPVVDRRVEAGRLAQEAERRAEFRRAARPAQRSMVREFLIRDAHRARTARLARSPHDQPNLRSADHNVARERANSMFELQITPIARFAWEGYSPHDADPAWPSLFDHALREVRLEYHHVLTGSEPAGDPLVIDSAGLLDRAAQRAARRLHDLGQLQRRIGE